MQTIPSDLIAKLLKQFTAFIVIFDWSKEESIQMLEEWTDFAKSVKVDPPIFLIGCNIDLVNPEKKDELSKTVEQIKMKKIIFNHIDLTSMPNSNTQQKIKLMLTMVTQDCITAEAAARRRSTFLPTNDPNWGFILVD